MTNEHFPSPSLDATDRRLLNILQQDAKTSINDLAKQLGLTKTPIYERIRRLEREGFIERYVAIVNKKKAKVGMTVFCVLTLEQQKSEYHFKLMEEVNKFPEVLEAYAMGGGYDFFLKVVVSDLDSYYEFASKKLANLPHIGNVSSSFVLAEVKNTTAVPL